MNILAYYFEKCEIKHPVVPLVTVLRGVILIIYKLYRFLKDVLSEGDRLSEI